MGELGALRRGNAGAGEIAVELGLDQALEDRPGDGDAEAAAGLATADSKMDELRSDQFHLLLSDDWEYGVEKAVDTALLGRYYERIADHAVAMGARTIYIVTGEAPEGENWPSSF